MQHNIVGSKQPMQPDLIKIKRKTVLNITEIYNNLFTCGDVGYAIMILYHNIRAVINKQKPCTANDWINHS